MVACADPDTCMSVCSNPTGCSNIAYPLLILKMAPVGMRGLMMAAMVAALMSSLTSIFNSAGTVFTMDIWRKFRPQASEKQLLVVGRLFVVVLVAVSITWIPLIVGSQKGQLFIYIQAVTGYVAPPICSIFLMALFVPRINETGAFWGVVAGQATGVTRLILDFVYPAPGCGQEDTRPLVVARVNFTYFSAVVLAVTAIVALLVSLTAPAQDKEEIEGLTWWSIRNMRREPTGSQRTSNTYVIDKGTTHEQEQGLNSEETKLTEEHEEKTTVGGDDIKPLSRVLAEVDSEETETIPVTADIQVEVTRTSLQEVFNVEVPSPWCHVLNAGAVMLLASLAVFLGFFA
ncbi:hypothetical protein V1264_004946 [Littorina saxatilis]|uniref:Sodium/glucose cotransporter 4 n=2 Tax=Littorina saxatilis TaxID=31220 RepID=A0AAN9G764_9CAEN